MLILAMDGYRAVMRLAQEDAPWLPVVRAAFQRAVASRPYGGEFAGAWVLRELGSWVPNLRLLVRYGILEKTDLTRGGNRAYYRMPDMDGVRRALSELDAISPPGDTQPASSGAG
jgi:hypothetical protein